MKRRASIFVLTLFFALSCKPDVVKPVCEPDVVPEDYDRSSLRKAVMDWQAKGPHDSCEVLEGVTVLVMASEESSLMCGQLRSGEHPAACTVQYWKFDGLTMYKIYIDTGEVDEDRAAYHEMLHVLLWSQGLEPGDAGRIHHEAMLRKGLW